MVLLEQKQQMQKMQQLLDLKNCAPFTKCNLEINDEHLDTAEI